MQTSSKSAQDLVISANGAAVSEEALKGAMQQTTIASKAAALGMKALSVAGNMLLMYGISQLISGMIQLTQVSSDVADKAKELGGEFSQTKSDIEGYKTRIQDLYKTINDSGSSVEEVTAARRDLLTVQDELINKFGSEKSAIDLVTQSINGQVGALDKLTAKQWQAILNDFNDGGFINNVGNFLGGYDNNIDRMLGEYENYSVTLDIDQLKRSLSKEDFSEVSKKLEDIGVDIGTNVNSLAIGTLSGTASEVYDKLLEIQTLSEDIDLGDRLENQLSILANQAKSTASEYEEFYNQYILQEKILKNDSYADAFGKINEAQKAYEEAFASGGDTDAAIANFSKVFDEATANISDENVLNYFKNLYPDLSALVEKWEFKANILPEFDTSKLKGKNKNSILEMLETAGLQDGEELFNSILDKATELGIVNGTNSEKINSLLDLLVEWGILQDSVTSSALQTKDAVDKTASSISQIVADENSLYSKANAALESENKGSAYDSMLEMAKKAKELQKSGDIGTDDFKSIATMFSPSGADDTDNFSENLKKINRYFTEDNSGLLNFLNDLKDNGFAELNKETQEWSYSIDDLEEAARKMGMGFEPFMAMFGKLEDKGFYNDFFTTQEEGMEVLSELYGDLGTAQMELDNLYANDPSNKSAIKAKEEEVAQLQERIKDTTNDLGKLFEKNAEDYAQEDKAARAGLNAQIEAFNANKGNMSEEAQNRMLADIQERGSEYGYGNIGIVKGQLVLDTTLADKAIEEIQDTELDEKVVELSCEDDATGYLILWNTLQANPKFTSLSAEDQATYVLNLWNGMSLEEKKAIVNGEDNATPMLNEIQSYEIEGKNFEINAEDKASGILENVVNWFGKIRNKTATVTVSTKVKGDKATGGTITKADGTFHAHAQGTDVAIREHQEAVVNEIDNEGLVRNGVLHEIKGGAQLIKLRPGDIIFNHKQMQELKKKGRVTSGGGHGRLIGGGAFANGTINAFSTGGGKLAVDDSNSSKNAGNKSTKDTDNSSKKTKETTAKLFDWIERRIQKFQTKFDRWIKEAETAVTSGFVTKYYNRAATAEKNLMNTQGSAYTYYMKKANKVGLSNKYEKKVKNGKISIENVKSEKTQTKIDNYQSYYDKAQQALDAFRESAEKFYNIPLEKSAKKIELLSEAIELLDAKLENADGYTTQNNILETQIDKQKQILDASNSAETETGKKLTSAGKTLKKSANLKGLSKDNKKTVKDAIKASEEIDISLFKEGSKGYQAAVKYNEALKANKKAIYEADLAQEEYTSTLHENRMQQLENIKAEYDSKDAILDASTSRLQAMNDLKESRGEYLSTSDYEGLLGNASANILNQEEELKEYVERFNQNRADMSAEDIADAEAYIEEMKAGITEAKQEQQELNNAVANLPYEKYERQLELLDAIAEKRKSEVDLAEAQGKDLLESDYTDQINNNLTEIKLLEAERNQAYNDYMNAMRNGGVYGGKSAEEWQKEYLGLDAEINGVKADNEALKDSLRDDVYWRDFERAHKACEDLQSVLEGMDGLIDEAMMFDDDGNFTDLGVSHIANLVKQYENARDEVQNYTDDIQNLYELESTYSPDEFKEKLAELQNGLFDSADAMKSYMQSIKDMYKQQEQAELDNLFEIIDARNEALQKKKEYYDYDKNLRNQTKELQILEAERAALEGINTAEAKAKKAQLDAEIAEQKEALDETVEQHLMDISSEALDSLKETMQDAFDKRWEDMDKNTQKIVGLMETANELSTQNAASIKNAMYDLLRFYGIEPSDTELTSVTGYAGGTKKVPRDMIAMINESGAEMIVTKYGLLTPLSQGDGVIPADMTENLMRMATTGNIGTPEIITPQIQMPNVESGNVLIVEGNLLNIEGHTTAVTKDDLNDYSKKLENTLVEKSYKYTSNKMYSGYLKTGGKRRI